MKCIALFAALIITTSSSLTLCAVDSTLVGFWMFDEAIGDSIVDSNTIQNHGLLNGQVSRRKGVNGNALEFDGSGSFAEIPSLYSTSPSELSVSLWAKVLQPNVEYASLFHHGRYGDVTIEVQSGRVVAGVNLSGIDWHLVTLPLVLDTLWHQVALVWRQGNSLTMYLDGDSAQSMVLPDVPLFHASWICCSFGAFKPCDLPSDHRFRGSIDDAKVWKRALSPEEVAVEYHRVLLGTIGDFDNNAILTISDAVAAINYIFSGGVPPDPLIRGDADCNGIITISDAVYLIQYIFAGGPPPCES